MCLRHSCDRGARLKRLLHDLPTFQFCTISSSLTRVSIRFHRSSHSNLSVACKNDGSRPGRLDGLHKTLTLMVDQPRYVKWSSRRKRTSDWSHRAREANWKTDVGFSS